MNRHHESHALISVDNDALQAYRGRRERLKSIEILQQNVTNIKAEVAEIKNLLQQIIQDKK